MKPLTLLLWLLMPVALFGAEDPVPAADLSAQFAAANAAYDQGDFEGAIAGYRKIMDQGYAPAEVLFNCGNAYFRSGQPGPAILQYRRAWYEQPRDADILANQELARQRTGALVPHRSVIDRIGQEFSRREWTSVMETGYWIMLGAVGVSLLFRFGRRELRSLALLAGLVAAAGFGGRTYWIQMERTGEAVVIAQRQTALYEPREKATPFFSVPEGSIVACEDGFDAWVKIRAGDKSGWLPKTALEPVRTWMF